MANDKTFELLLTTEDFKELICILTNYKMNATKLFNLKQGIKEEARAEKFIDILCNNFN